MRQSLSQVSPESGGRGPSPAETRPAAAAHRGPVVERIAGWSVRHRKTAVFGWPDGRVAQMLMVEPFVAFGAVKFKFDPLGG